MEERIDIGLDPKEDMALLRAGLDENEREVPRCLREIVIPKSESQRNRFRVRPAFELQACKRETEPPR